MIRVTVRKIWIALADSYPSPSLFRRVYENLQAVPPAPAEEKSPEMVTVRIETAEIVRAEVAQNPGVPSDAPP